MVYEVTYGLKDEEYNKEFEATDDYQAYLIGSKTLYDLITFREYSKGAFMSISRQEDSRASV